MSENKRNEAFEAGEAKIMGKKIDSIIRKSMAIAKSLSGTLDLPVHCIDSYKRVILLIIGEITYNVIALTRTQDLCEDEIVWRMKNLVQLSFESKTLLEVIDKETTEPRWSVDVSGKIVQS